MSFHLDRRHFLAATGLTLLGVRAGATAPSRKTLALELVPRDISLRTGQTVSAWRFADDTVPRFAQGDEVEVTIANRLPVAVVIDWRGLDGAPALEPLLTRGPISVGGSDTYKMVLNHAGTLICDARLTQGSVSKPLPLLPIVVSETAPPSMDHDAILLIEDWPQDGGEPIYTVNGKSSFGLQANSGDRLRLRVINGTQTTVIAVKLAGLDVCVIAIDGQPSEPFLARDSRLVLAPGSRIDAVVDMAAEAVVILLDDGVRSSKIGDIVVSGASRRATPLPPVTALASNGLPEKLALQGALREDIKLDASWGWVMPAQITPATPPSFRVKRDRTVVLALQNPSDKTVIFHLHGHHMRLLDRLDDGWKPFWLDTVAVPGKQTIRVAFGATHPGAYLMEMLRAVAGSQRLFRSYLVEA